MPLFSVLEQVFTSGIQPLSVGGNKCIAFAYSARAIFALSEFVIHHDHSDWEYQSF